MNQARISVLTSLLGLCRMLVGAADPSVAAAAAEQQAKLSAELADAMGESALANPTPAAGQQAAA